MFLILNEAFIDLEKSKPLVEETRNLMRVYSSRRSTHLSLYCSPTAKQGHLQLIVIAYLEPNPTNNNYIHSVFPIW